MQCCVLYTAQSPLSSKKSMNLFDITMRTIAGGCFPGVQCGQSHPPLATPAAICPAAHFSQQPATTSTQPDAAGHISSTLCPGHAPFCPLPDGGWATFGGRGHIGALPCNRPADRGPRAVGCKCSMVAHGQYSLEATDYSQQGVAGDSFFSLVFCTLCSVPKFRAIEH